MALKAMAMAMAAALLCACAASAVAQDEPKSGTDVTADEMEIIDAENKTIFRGNVEALRDKTKINSKELVVNYSPVKQPDGSEKKEIDVIRAKDNVVIVTENETITSEWANIYDREDRLEAGGNVKLVQGSNTIRGQKLVINLKTKQTVMTGGRVKGSFLPQ
jgi:lipopolysaccharide export system protein LptA